MPRELGNIAGYSAPPEQIIKEAISSRSKSIAYTYTEPTIFFEYSYDIAKLAKENGIHNIYVTNGYMTKEMLDMFHPYLDGANVDLKSFNDRTYRRLSGAKLQPVLDTLKEMKKLGIWVEVTTLVIPGINDSIDELRQIAKFIANELGINTPWHLSRFYPHYKMRNVPSTSIDRLITAKDIGLEEGLRYVYLGNIGGETNTTCHHCGSLLIRRQGYWVSEINIKDNACPSCSAIIPGVWG